MAENTLSYGFPNDCQKGSREPWWASGAADAPCLWPQGPQAPSYQAVRSTGTSLPCWTAPRAEHDAKLSELLWARSTNHGQGLAHAWLDRGCT